MRTNPMFKPDEQPMFACPHYCPGKRTKRCKHNSAGDYCARFLDKCIEWQLARGKEVPKDHPAFLLQPQAAPMPKPVADPVPPAPERQPDAPPLTANNLESLTKYLDERVDSFKRLGVEVEFQTEDGPVWLVGEYTGKDRTEISVADAVSLRLMVDAFPGSRITRFVRRAEVVA